MGGARIHRPRRAVVRRPQIAYDARMKELPRRLGLFDGAALLVGAVIGSGIFVVPSLIAQRIPEPGLVIAIWVFSGLLVVCGALTLAELGAMLPHSGGLYVYIREAYGPLWGFLYGWTNMLVVIPGSIAALTSAFLLYLRHFVSLPMWGEKALGIALLLGLAFVNTRGVRWGARVQGLFTFLKVAGLAGLVVAALVTQRGSADNFTPFFPDTVPAGIGTAVGLAMVSTLFAYDGWHFVGFVAGEIREPQRNLPRAIGLGVLVVIAVYVLANVAYVFVLGQPAIARSERVAADAMTAMVGPVGGGVISAAILCSTFGAISANVLAGPRVFFAMAHDGLFFRRLAAVHPRFETPANAIWALGAWAALLTLTGGYEDLITMAMFANWILFSLVVFAVIVLRRKRPAWPRPFRVPGYPVTVLVFVLVAASFVVNTLVETPKSSLLGLGLLLLGLPFYARWRRRSP
jgi:APA family basic amino acid/polyamine antiporter